jgi:hypothetical protein
VASDMASAKKTARSSKQGRGAGCGFKPDAAAGLNRNATTSACVGWDIRNIENRFAFRKQRHRTSLVQALPSKRLDDHQYDDADHQYGRHFIDNPIEFLAARVLVGGKILHATDKKAVDTRKHQHQ